MKEEKNMDLKQETKQIMLQYGIYASKNLGQNFLINEYLIEKIIDEANITQKDLVIEIGPGLGNLTKHLLTRAGKVICIELDSRMVSILKQRFKSFFNFEIINEDILKVDLKKIIEKNNTMKVKVVANLPYYITTPIVMKLLEEKLSLESITIMIQKEVADRLTAICGKKNTGAITYTINYYTEPRKVVNVPSTDFIPEPKVNSSVIQLKILPQPKVKVKNEEKFFKIIHYAFMQKRKTLLNTLTNAKILGDKKHVEEMLKNLDISPQIRAEKLTIEQFAKISDYYD